jgi:hypothetical protein
MFFGILEKVRKLIIILVRYPNDEEADVAAVGRLWVETSDAADPRRCLDE